MDTILPGRPPLPLRDLWRPVIGRCSPGRWSRKAPYWFVAHLKALEGCAQSQLVIPWSSELPVLKLKSSRVQYIWWKGLSQQRGTHIQLNSADESQFEEMHSLEIWINLAASTKSFSHWSHIEKTAELVWNTVGRDDFFNDSHVRFWPGLWIVDMGDLSPWQSQWWWFGWWSRQVGLFQPEIDFK